MVTSPLTSPISRRIRKHRKSSSRSRTWKAESTKNESNNFQNTGDCENRPSFTSLPAEIIENILRNINSFSDLGSLERTSSVFRSLVMERREKILMSTPWTVIVETNHEKMAEIWAFLGEERLPIAPINLRIFKGMGGETATLLHSSLRTGSMLALKTFLGQPSFPYVRPTVKDRREFFPVEVFGTSTSFSCYFVDHLRNKRWRLTTLSGKGIVDYQDSSFAYEDGVFSPKIEDITQCEESCCDGTSNDEDWFFIDEKTSFDGRCPPRQNKRQDLGMFSCGNLIDFLEDDRPSLGVCQM